MARAARLDLRTFQQELATRLVSKTAAQVESSRLGFTCGESNWLVRLADAGEVVAVPQVSAVPLTKRWFVGVANIRGNLYSVIDFAAYLGVESGAAGRPGRLVLFGPRVGEFRAGLVVQKVVGLRNLSELAPAAAPTDARDWFGQRWMDADGSVWQEIDLARLVKDAAFLQAGL